MLQIDVRYSRVVACIKRISMLRIRFFLFGFRACAPSASIKPVFINNFFFYFNILPDSLVPKYS